MPAAIVAMDQRLRDAQKRKEFWEGLGASFSLAEDGSIVATATGGLDYDSTAKKDLAKFVKEYSREIHALVVTDGSDAAVERFNFVMDMRKRGRFTDDPGDEL